MPSRNGLLSVVVPLYNKRAEVLRCINSIIAQTVPPNEVIVVDDGSTDGSGGIVAAVKYPCLRVISQANQGECVARNTGIRAARGSLIAFLDADDEWHPEFCAEILQLKRAFPDAGAYTTAYTINKGPFGKYSPVCNVPSEHFLLKVGEGFRPCFSAPAAMWSSSSAVWRDVFDTVGFFRPGIRKGGDIDMWFRIACLYATAYSRKPRAVWHWTANNRSTGLRPNEEDFLATSLNELTSRGLVSESVLPGAQAYLRRFNLLNARDLTRHDREKGLAALRAWRRIHGATPEWYLHYIPLLCSPKSYWSARRGGAWAKGLMRTVLDKLQTA